MSGQRSAASSQQSLAAAVARRHALAGRADLTCFRFAHGAADGMPGLAIDRFGDLLVAHADSRAVLERWKEPIRRELAWARAAYAKVHPRQASRGGGESLHLWGPPIEELEVVENDVRFAVRTDAGLSVGLFLDMREVRAWLRKSAAGKRVLNLFAYTCSLGIAASLGGASRVLNLDLSKPYLAWGRQNYFLNELEPDERDFVFGDGFDWLGRFARRREQFDVVIVDPPSFSTSREGRFTAEGDYPRLAAASARVVAPGGMLLAATNHAGISDAQFDAMLRTGLETAQRRYRIQQRWHEPAPDFPLVAGRPPYLKVRALALD